ncbi:hypothetical protein DMN91_007644 [Ooceraea biroi]|uniref:Uncharacterized protein n=1 Tax=Ooceraea biroi TaxID=2015173 RepID=A0A3L8DMH8_OOCBI|nr:hypothetical protein DMN91_007644 [Ooceraea biroi]
MRRRVEEDEVVTAWRVVKRRMAKGAARGGEGSEGRNGIRVEGRSREHQRGLRGDEHSRGDERVADHAELRRAAQIGAAQSGAERHGRGV